QRVLVGLAKPGIEGKVKLGLKLGEIGPNGGAQPGFFRRQQEPDAAVILAPTLDQACGIGGHQAVSEAELEREGEKVLVAVYRGGSPFPLRSNLLQHLL